MEAVQPVEHAETITACLNCGAPLHGPFCSACGQRHVEPTKDGLVTLFLEAAAGARRFFVVARDSFVLVFRPGHLTLEYLRGRRAGHAHPWTMWATWWAVSLAVSALFRRSHEDELAATFEASFRRASEEAQNAAVALDTVGDLLTRSLTSAIVLVLAPLLVRLLCGPHRRGMLPYSVLALHIGAWESLVTLPLVAVAGMATLAQNEALQVATFGALLLVYLPSSLLYVALSVRRSLNRTFGQGLLVAVSYLGVTWTLVFALAGAQMVALAAILDP